MLQCPLQRNHGRHRIRRRRAQPSLYRQPLLDLNADFPLSAEFIHHALGHAIAGIRRIQRNPRIFTLAENFNPTAAPDADPNHVMQRDRLVNRAQIVKSVRARPADVKPEIDLTPGPLSRFPVGPVPGYRVSRKEHALPIVRDEFRPAIPRRVARQHCPSALHRHFQDNSYPLTAERIYHRTVASVLTVCLTKRGNPKRSTPPKSVFRRLPGIDGWRSSNSIGHSEAAGISITRSGRMGGSESDQTRLRP